MNFNNNAVDKNKNDPTARDESLDRLNAAINWNMFIPVLDEAIQRKTGGKGGRPSFNSLLMFKILIVKWNKNLSFDQTEDQIYKKIAYRNFLECKRDDLIPDSKTIWLYKDRLTKSGYADKLADMLTKAMLRNRNTKEILASSKTRFADEFTNKRNPQNIQNVRAETAKRQNSTGYPYGRSAEPVSASGASITETGLPQF